LLTLEITIQDNGIYLRKSSKINLAHRQIQAVRQVL